MDLAIRYQVTTLDELRAEALFASDLQPSQHPGPERVRRAVARMLHRHGWRWCAGRMAEEFGAHPESASQRMRWALRVVRDCFARPLPVRPTRCRASGRSASWVTVGQPAAGGGYRATSRCPCPVDRQRRPPS